MPAYNAPCVELGSAPETTSIGPSPSSSEISSASSPEPQFIRATPIFRALALPPPEPEQPPGQEELERRLPGYRRIVIPRELTLIELLKQCSGVTTDEEVLRIRDAKLRVIAERVGLRRLNVLAPRLRSLTLDGSAISSLRDLGIGLVCLKVLSINRCGLTSLDGVWGLGSLRELQAAGNHLSDLYPLSALQKLHTLNLADNPIADANRVWTLAVCSSLRRLTLKGTDAYDMPQYRTKVASALPMLVYLDDHPLHMDVAYDSDGIFGTVSSSSDTEDSEPEVDVKGAKTPTASENDKPFVENNHLSLLCEESYSSSCKKEVEAVGGKLPAVTQRRRPATTEEAVNRPRVPAPLRPRTATDRPTIDMPSRLQILNTLMDKEWRCSGSKLTSERTVCGNLARALRRPSTAHRPQVAEVEKESMERVIGDISRSLAEEIPRAPRLEDWVKFKAETGIDINIDFNERPMAMDATKAIERLEQIEKETIERFKEEENIYFKRDDTTGSFTSEYEKGSDQTSDSERDDRQKQMQRRLFEFFNNQDSGDNSDKYNQ